MTAWVTMRDARRAARHTDDEDSTETTPVTPTQQVDPNAATEGEQQTETAPRDQGDGGTEQDQPEVTPDTGTEDQTPTPETPEPETPATDPNQPPSGGGGTGGGVTPDTSP
jgi:hypothetical protein